MPRRGGARWQSNNGGRFSGNKQDYSEHDDRSDFRQNRDNKGGRRVSFKPVSGGGRGGNSRNQRFSQKALQAHFDDEEMRGNQEGGYTTKNFRGKGSIRRRGSPIPRAGGSGMGKNYGKKRLTAGTAGWFQVTIPYCAKYGKQEVYRFILNQIQPELFIPHYYQEKDNSAIFYLDDIKTAQIILDADRQIELPSGHKMKIIVNNGLPHASVDESVAEKMKLAMVKRYNPATKALDLTKFHSDPDLLDVFCALFRPAFMIQAIRIISENIPDLEALNLNDNKINLMTHFQDLASKMPNLKILYLANNRIPTMSSLDCLKGVPLVELMLDNNPFKDRINPKIYVSEIRKKFPKLLKLDGQELPPQIGFDVGDASDLPKPKASFLCNTAGADIVRQFLEQYFIVYDSSNRQPLLEAYHENAMFSMTVGSFQTNNQPKLGAYFQYSRNLNRIRDYDVKMKLLKNGRLPVVSFLSELPATQHDPQSFAVDLTLFTPQLMMLTVTGIFREKRSNNQTLLRSFQKTLVIVPAGGGFCIRNEMLHLNNVTQSQTSGAFKGPPPATVAAPIPAPIVPSPAQQVVPRSLDDNTKAQMVQAMSANSHMNLEWSRKCLEETNWDFDRAGFVFSELQKQNKIPPEAFVK